MGQFTKNLTKTLAWQALNVGGISQTQEKTNNGFETGADWLGKLLAAGYALQRSKKPADLALLEELTAGSEIWRKKVANVLLENEGAAVSGLLCIITNPKTL